MRKNYIRRETLRVAIATIILLTISSALGYFFEKLNVPLPSNGSPFFTYLYAVVGILFSLGISMSISFEYSDIYDNNYYSRLSKDLTHIVHLLIAIFFISTLLLLLGVFGALNIDFKPIAFMPLTFQITSIAWMSYIFLRLYRLKKDLNDQRRKNKTDS